MDGLLMVVVDTSILLLFFDPKAPGPRDSKGKPLKSARERIEYLIADLNQSQQKILIPTPVLGELLIKKTVSESQKIVEVLNTGSVFEIQSFDQRAAIEHAAIIRKEIEGKRIREGPETWAKMKFDRQVVAIAKVCGASAIYSEDEHIHALADRLKIPAYRVRDLPLPPGSDQLDLLGEVDRPKELPPAEEPPEESLT